MSNKPILVLKDIQTLQTIGASKRPSFMGMLRTALAGRDREGTQSEESRRLGNALGVGASTWGQDSLQAAHSMQGGNLFAPLRWTNVQKDLTQLVHLVKATMRILVKEIQVAGRNNAARRFIATRTSTPRSSTDYYWDRLP